MKNLLNLRNNKMNLSLRSILASSLIALTMMSCSKENIEPASVDSFDNGRKRSQTSIDENAQRANHESADGNAQALIDIQIDATLEEPAYRILITRSADVIISSNGEKANQFSQYRLSPIKFTHLLDYIETFNNNDQDFTANNTSSLNINQVEYRSCSNCNANSLHNGGNAQERTALGTFIQEVDKIIDIQSLLHLHHNNNAQK